MRGEERGSDPETVTDTLFNKIVCLFCIHFGLPGPPLDAPAALKAPQERSQMLLETLPELPFGSPEPSKSFQMASGTIWAPQKRSQTLSETLPELPFWPPEPSKSFQMTSGTLWAPFSIRF